VFNYISNRLFWVDFTNTLRAAFKLTDPKTVKDTDDLTVFFAHLGSARVKTARKTLVKSTDPIQKMHDSLSGGQGIAIVHFSSEFINLGSKNCV